MWQLLMIETKIGNYKVLPKSEGCILEPIISMSDVMLDSQKKSVLKIFEYYLKKINKVRIIMKEPAI